MLCNEFSRLAVFYACDELDPGPRAAIEEHAAACPSCAAVLENERRLIEAVVCRRQLGPSAVFLAQCRGDLADALDDSAPVTRWQRLSGWLRPGTWFAFNPALSAAVCILLGITLGTAFPWWWQHRARVSPASSPVDVYPATALAGEDFQNLPIERISFIPGASADQPDVEVQMVDLQPFVLKGTLDNSNVRRALLYVIQNNQRFDSGLRLDSLEALRSRSNDAEIRQALCFAARSDRNPAVRLKALEALRGFEQEEQVRKTLLEALLRDDNPGVRIEAIGTLRAAAERAEGQPDPQLLRVFRDRMQNDPNTFIRMQSAAAVRQLVTRAQH